MNTPIYDFIIVGAGMTGLNLAFELQLHAPTLDILVIEKSKGCGGRMATRRIGEDRFDHGAQFINEATISKKLIEFLKNHTVLQDFSYSEKKSYCGIHGMTSPAKKLAESLSISFNTKLINFQKSDSNFELVCEDGRKLIAKQIVFTSPLPQSLDILTASGMDYDADLKSVTYSSAIVLLAEFASKIDMDRPYIEFENDDIYSICSQSAKGLSQKNTYTICMSEAWSQQHFSINEEELSDKSKSFLKNRFISNHLKSLDVKKWKFCKPKKTWQDLYYSPTPGVILAGDAFAGPSLNGALRSSYAVFEILKKSINTNGGIL